MLNKKGLRRSAMPLSLAVLLSLGGADPSHAQSTRLPSGFDEFFSDPGGEVPLFIRPEVTRSMPALPLETDQIGSASTGAVVPEKAAAPSTPPPEDKLTRRLKGLLVTPAEASTAKTPPPPQPLPVPPLAVGVPQQVEPVLPQASAPAPAGRPETAPAGKLVAEGRAVWYQHPGRTASGETYNPDGLTAAHHHLPLGTRLRVVNKKNGRSVEVRVNDRMPAKAKYTIDLSRGSARALGIEGVGSVALYEVD